MRSQSTRSCLYTLFILLQSSRVMDVMGQQDSIFILREVEVTEQRIDITGIGKHTERLDSAAMVRHYENLTSLLSNNTPLFIRSTGPGTLATLGIRGGSASHTQILWNGIPIRNPMVGLVDLSLIPVNFIDEAAIHYGGHGAAFGSGAIGGLIEVGNKKFSPADKAIFGIDVGSWGYRNGNVQLDYGTSRARFSSRLFSQAAIYDFSYRLSKDLPQRKQVHHEMLNHGYLQEIALLLSDQQTITGRFWYQSAHRQIPPTSVQNTSKAAQQDENYRAALQWDHNGEKMQWQLKAAWLDETINYQDTLILLYTNNHFQTFLGEAGTSFYLSEKLHFTAGLYAETSKAMSANYSEQIQRDQTAFYSSLRFLSGPFNLRLQAREEVTIGDWSPVLFDVSGEWSANQNTVFKTSYSRNYRTPTINDLYWRPGGNPNLQPEEGWTAEGGIHYSNNSNAVYFKSSLTFYTRMITNWIMWMPPTKDVSIVWTPVNVAEVKSQGFESRIRTGWSNLHYGMDLSVGADFTWSTFNTPLIEFGVEAGDQLFYVPVENILGGIDFRFHNWVFHYNHRYYGEASGINEPVKSFQVGNASVTYHLSKLPVLGNIFFQADNVWDTPYRVVERRPMPGRALLAGFRLIF